MRHKPTIDSLPGAFDVVMEMRSDGSEWAEGASSVGPQAVEQIVDREMAGLRDFHQGQLLVQCLGDPPGASRAAGFARWLEQRRTRKGR